MTPTIASQQTHPEVGSRAWKNLETHYKEIRAVHLRQFFAGGATPGERLTASAACIDLDYSKNRTSDETLVQRIRSECPVNAAIAR